MPLTVFPGRNPLVVRPEGFGVVLGVILVKHLKRAGSGVIATPKISRGVQPEVTQTATDIIFFNVLRLALHICKLGPQVIGRSK